MRFSPEILRQVRAIYTAAPVSSPLSNPAIWPLLPTTIKQNRRGPRRAFVTAVKVDCKATDPLTLRASFEGRRILIQSIETWKDILSTEKFEVQDHG